MGENVVPAPEAVQAAAAAVPSWLLFIHVLAVVLYVGGLLTLTRMLGHGVRFESADARASLYRVLKRMYLFVGLPGVFLLVGSGLAMLLTDPAGNEYMKQGYFHVKLTGVLLVLVADFVLMRKLFAIDPAGAQPKAAIFKALHGITGLGLIAVLVAIYFIRG